MNKDANFANQDPVTSPFSASISAQSVAHPTIYSVTAPHFPQLYSIFSVSIHFYPSLAFFKKLPSIPYGEPPGARLLSWRPQQFCEFHYRSWNKKQKIRRIQKISQLIAQYSGKPTVGYQYNGPCSESVAIASALIQTKFSSNQ